MRPRTVPPVTGRRTKQKRKKLSTFRLAGRMIKAPLPTAVFRLDKTQLQKMYGPCVYFFHKDRKALYIGMSAYGLQRVFNHDSSILGRRRVKAMREAEGLTVLFFPTEAQAAEAEAWWIQQARPAYQHSGDIPVPGTKKAPVAPAVRKNKPAQPRPVRMNRPMPVGRMKRPICQATSQRYRTGCPCPPCKRYWKARRMADRQGELPGESGAAVIKKA